VLCAIGAAAMVLKLVVAIQPTVLVIVTRDFEISAAGPDDTSLDKCATYFVSSTIAGDLR